MRSDLATIILGWGAVYGYAAFYGVALWRRSPQRREYRTFGLMALALIVQCAGGVLLTDAEDLATADIAVRIKLVGSSFTLAFVHHFAIQLARVSWPRMVKLGYAYAGICSLLAIAGLSTDPTRATAAPTWGFAAAPDYLEPQLTIAGSISAASAWIIVASTIAALTRAARQDERARLVLWAFIINTLAVTHDALVHAASLRSIYLSEHAAILTMAAVSTILLDRYTRTSVELDLRTRELSSSVGELQHTEAELVKKEQLAAVGALSGLIAQQVEAPLQTIRRASSELRRDAPSAEERLTHLEMLDVEVDRLNRLVDDLLAYARPVKPQMRPVAIAELVEHALSLRVPPDSPLRSETDFSDAPMVIYGDGDLLRTALDNVIANAIDAMPTGGTLRVAARSAELDDEAGVRLEVSDSGVGMNDSTHERARDPFFTTRHLGTGLGLAIVDRVIKMHGGQLTIESRPDHGTTVTIGLPVGQPSSSITPVDDSEDEPPEVER